MHHHDTGALAALTHLPAPVLRLEREPSNDFDPNAIAVVLGDASKKLKLGYVAKEEAACLAPFLDDGGQEAPVIVERVLLMPPPARKEQEEAEPIKPDLDAPSPSSSSPASPIPTSVAVKAHVQAQDEGAYLALLQAFSLPAPAATDDQAEAAAAAVAQEEHERVLGVLAAACAKIEREGRKGLRVLSLFDGIGAALVSLLKEELPLVS